MVLALSALVRIPNSVAAPTDFSVGVTLPLTGALTEYGAAIQNGIQLAREEHPEKFQNVRFVYEDDGYEPKRAISALHKLRSIDRVDVVLGWGTETVLAESPIAESRRIPFLAGALDPRAYRGRRYVIGLFAPFEEYTCKLVEVFRR